MNSKLRGGLIKQAAALVAAALLAPGCFSPLYENGDGVIQGVVVLSGSDDSSGVQVVLSPGGATTTSGPDGSYSFTHLSPGLYSLAFSKGPYADSIPTVQVLEGQNANVLDTSYYPLAPFEIAQGARVQSFMSEAGLRFSPDGGAVAFTASDDGGSLFLAAVDGMSRTLDTGPIGYNFAFSPNGDWLYWLNDNVLKGAQLGDGAPVTFRSPVLAMPTFSRDGKALAFGDTNDAFLMFVGASSARDLGPRSTACESALTPTFASNDSLVWKGATANPMGYCEPLSVHVSPADGGADTVFDDAGSYDVSSDGRLLAVSVGYCEGPNYGCGVASDGLEDVAVVGGSALTSLGPGVAAGSSYGVAVFSSDDRRLLYLDATGPAEVNVDGTAFHQLAQFSGGCAIYAFSPDNQFAVYQAGGSVTCDLYSAPFDGGAPIHLGTNINTNSLTGGCGGECPYEWLNAGNGSIMFIDGLSEVNGAGTLRRVDWSTGTSTTIDSSVLPSILLSQDGGQVFYSKGPLGQPGALFVSSLSAPSPTPLGTMGRLGGLSPDGTQMLVYTGCTGTSCQLQVATVSSGSLVLLDPAGGPGAWAPDSHAVAYVQGGNPAGALHVVSRDGSSNSVFMDGAELAGWAGPHELWAIRKGVPAPYRFQNGLYRVTVP